MNRSFADRIKKMGCEAARKTREKEDGNIVDQVGSLILILFVSAMIVAYAAYGRMVQIRLRIDNACKEALYAMEQEGYMSSDTQDKLEASLSKEGVSVVAYSLSDTEKTTTDQVAYGDPVELACKVEFDNPLLVVFNTNTMFFDLAGMSRTLSYDVSMSATSKW